MIPTIRNLIDVANNATENGEGGSNDQRIRIPPMELAALGEFRRSEYTRHAQEERNSGILEAEARARVDPGDEADVRRQYGLPHGMACLDIWELIFEHVEDLEDIANLHNTCVLFREMLERKYRTLRFLQISLKFATEFGGFTFILDLRRVCKSSKAAVDRFLSEVKLPCVLDVDLGLFDSYLDEYRVSMPGLCFLPEEPSLSNLENLVRSLEQQQVAPNRFPINWFSLVEIEGDLRNVQNVVVDPDMGHDPVRTALRTRFDRFLGLAGSSIRNFECISVMDLRDAYNQLRSWVSLMPNLEELSAGGGRAIENYGNNPELLNLNPFPHCPKLKRYIHRGSGYSIPFISRIFQANPGISDVFLGYFPWMQQQEDDYANRLLGILNMVQLEEFQLVGVSVIPPLQFLEFRPKWPLKSLSLLILGEDRETASRTLFAFANSFKETLEELKVNWKIRDAGGFLDLPKVSILCWKLWPNYMTLEFMIALESLKYLDLDVVACPEINNSFENVKGFINEDNLPSIFPTLRRIRARMGAQGQWLPVFKA